MAGLPALLADVAGLAGVGLLAVPALHAARYAQKAGKLSRMRRRFGGALQGEVSKTIAELREIRDSWGAGKSFMLVTGTVLSALSYVIPLAAAVLA